MKEIGVEQTIRLMKEKYEVQLTNIEPNWNLISMSNVNPESESITFFNILTRIDLSNKPFILGFLKSPEMSVILFPRTEGNTSENA